MKKIINSLIVFLYWIVIRCVFESFYVSHSLSHSHKHSLPLPYTHSVCLTRIYALMHTQSHCLSHTLLLSFTHTDKISPSHTHTPSLALSPAFPAVNVEAKTSVFLIPLLKIFSLSLSSSQGGQMNPMTQLYYKKVTHPHTPTHSHVIDPIP